MQLPNIVIESKSEAAKFSFLMVIPLIFGSMAKKLFFSEVITFDFTASLRCKGGQMS